MKEKNALFSVKKETPKNYFCQPKPPAAASSRKEGHIWKTRSVNVCPRLDALWARPAARTRGARVTSRQDVPEWTASERSRGTAYLRQVRASSTSNSIFLRNQIKSSERRWRREEVAEPSRRRWRRMRGLHWAAGCCSASVWNVSLSESLK